MAGRSAVELAPLEPVKPKRIYRKYPRSSRTYVTVDGIPAGHVWLLGAEAVKCGCSFHRAGPGGRYAVIGGNDTALYRVLEWAAGEWPHAELVLDK